MGRCRPVSGDCVRHQAVGANRRDFPGWELARLFRSLRAENRSLGSVWRVKATFLGPARPKSQAANFRFQSWCLREVVSTVSGYGSASNGRSYMPPNGWSYLSARRRLEFERPPLRGPGHRKINQTLETEAARQVSFDGRFDDVGRKESEG